MNNTILLFIFLFLSNTGSLISPQKTVGTLIKEQLHSEILEDNLIGLNTTRDIHIYLPPGYDQSEKSYPVVYYFHNIYSNPTNELKNFEIIKWIDKAIQEKKIGEFILVAGDFTTPTTGSWYENSTTSGRWLDYIIEELIPFVEGKYRIIQNKENRALLGHYVGGRGALKLAMTHPATFNVVYAMHSVATGTGYEPSTALDVDWNRIHKASSFEEIDGLGRTTVFVALSQAFLPNPDRPPFYCDFIMEKEGEEIVLNPEHNLRYRQKFLLDETLEEHAENLRSMKAIAFDWARFDPTQAHVISNRRFSKLLNEFGIEHQGEEYAGNP